MSFMGMNYLAILIAAIAAFMFGAAYYGILSKPWMKAARITPDGPKMAPFPVLLLNSFICELIMAFVLAGLIGHLGPDTMSVKNGVISGLFIWVGFLATSMSVNHRYEGFGWGLTIIDGVHWLGVVMIMGAIIGYMGV